MKRVYIKPETELVNTSLVSMIAASNGTQWHMGDDPIGPDEPDPNSDDAKRWSIDLWEEDDDYNIWQ